MKLNIFYITLSIIVILVFGEFFYKVFNKQHLSTFEMLLPLIATGSWVLTDSLINKRNNYGSKIK